MKKKHNILLLLILFACSIFGQNVSRQDSAIVMVVDYIKPTSNTMYKQIKYKYQDNTWSFENHPVMSDSLFMIAEKAHIESMIKERGNLIREINKMTFQVQKMGIYIQQANKKLKKIQGGNS